MSLPSSMADFVPCDRLLQKTYCLNTEKLSEKVNANKVVASSEHESSIKSDSGVWFIRWQCKVLSQSFVIMSLDPNRL